MSSLDFESIKKVFPTQFKQYKKIKINLANNPIGTAGADHILSLIPNQVEELEVAFDSIDADFEAVSGPGGTDSRAESRAVDVV